MNKQNIIINIYKEIKNLNEKELYCYFIENKSELRKIISSQKQIHNILSTGILAKKQKEIYEKFDEAEEQDEFLYSYMGTPEEDYEFSKKDNILYDQLAKRSSDIYRKAETRFMGFYKEPNTNLVSFTSELMNHIERFNTLVALKTPEELMYHESEVLKKLLKSYTEDKFEDIEDPVYIESCLNFLKKQLSWTLSKEREDLIKQLYTYNKMQFDNIN
jgi:hypothetical protein